MKLTEKQKTEIKHAIGVACFGMVFAPKSIKNMVSGASDDIFKIIETEPEQPKKKESEQLKVAKLTVEEIKKEFGIPDDHKVEVEGLINEKETIENIETMFKRDFPELPKRFIVLGGHRLEMKDGVRRSIYDILGKL